MTSREYLSLNGPNRLGDRLLEAGLITRTQLDVALDYQQRRAVGRQRLGRTLVELGFLTDHDLIQMLSVYFGIPVAPFTIADAEERAIVSVPARLARRHRALPCRVVAGSLLVVVADGLPPSVVEELQTISGFSVLLYLGSEVDIEAALPKHYGRPSILPSQLRDLASDLHQLADSHERLALVLAAADQDTRRAPEYEAHLRAEIEQMRGNIETLLSALADVSSELRDRYGTDVRGTATSPRI
jgi:hypothetical protein